MIDHDWWTAFHEASHAVGCIERGVSVRHVSIEPTSEWGGVCNHEPTDERNLAIIALCGPLGVRMANLSLPIGHGAGQDATDFDGAVAKLAAERPSVPGIDWVKMITQGCSEEAAAIVRNSWWKISRLANALVERRTLTGDEVQAILETE